MSSVFPFAPAELQAAIGAAFVSDSLVIYDDAAFWYEAAGAPAPAAGENAEAGARERPTGARLAEPGEAKRSRPEAQPRQAPAAGGAGGRLAVLAGPEHPALARFHGERQEFRQGYRLKHCPTDWEHSQALRATLPWLQPTPLGLDASAGFGDRLGLATAGHVHVLRRVLGESPGKTLQPIFAQQSMRENERTHRTPEDVLNDATWGAFQAGWRGSVGADADHLKTTADVDACAAAGYSFYTIDPGAFVDGAADEAAPASIREKVEALPWSLLESSPADLARRYVGKTVDLETRQITLDEPAVQRAAAKYSRAVLHVATLYRHLAGKQVPFELEVSVDETETPTSPAEHIFIASELQRLGVRWVSMAPRYVGRFEKGIDYIGDLAALRQDLQTHAEIARALGPYKLSLHSGSDKFMVYPLISEAARGMAHLKTAGTSYVEALRVVARANPALFREILALACQHYPTDRASYHVSAEVSRIPDVRSIPDAALAALLDDVHIRQILHVTFGSVLAQFGAPLRETLQAHQADYNEVLDRHFYRHLKPFVE